ncbi:MAG TPA: ATP-binding protein [Povalibacter sp.]|uniref:GAF domain-containing sensor histidine kinase n=1 Tax=Povalibacter sp. TaxID=1962978 RepID=UPI002CD80013|nr:ATP-binding protein [Povalibacter sp.]HMN43816.1 ATP-binding protein [Povalibacter sp.]
MDQSVGSADAGEEALIGQLGIPAILAGSHGKVRAVNRAAVELLGEGLRPGSAIVTFLGIQPDTIDDQALWHRLLLAPGGHLSGVTVRFHFADGAKRDCVASLARDLQQELIQCVLIPGAYELHHAIAEVALTLTSGRELDATLKQIGAHACRLCRADRVYFEIHDEARNSSKFRAISARSSSDVLPHVEASPVGGLTAFVMNSHTTYRSGDIRTDGRVKFSPLFANTVSKVAVPLFFTEEKSQPDSERFLGVLMVDGNSCDQFGSDTEIILDTFARYATLAIAHARLLRQMREDSAAIVTQLRTLQDSLGGSKILHEGKNVIRQALYELEQIEQEVAAHASRRRRTPLRQAMEKLQEMGLILTDLLQSLRSPSDDGAETELADLNKVVRRVLNIVAVPEDKVEINVASQPGAGIVIASARETTFMVFNLIQNAIAAVVASAKKGRIDIEIGPSPERATYCRLVVEDTGIGMDRRFLELIRADQGVSKFRGGSGVGLVSIKETVLKTGGFIAVDSNFGKGTRITIDLPADV